MNKRHSAVLSVIALLSLGLATVAGTPQTKPNTAIAPKKSSPVVASTIPTIKCADPGTMAACRSLGQLVEARDKRILKILIGTQTDSAKLPDYFRPSNYYKHIAYVCLAKDDVFWTVDFDLPTAKGYEPYSYYLTGPEGYDFPDHGEAMRRSIEQSAFLDPSPNHPVAPSMQDEWYEEHLDSRIYTFGSVDSDAYASGVHSDGDTDFGKWSRLSEAQNSPSPDDDPTFEGAYVWLERHTGDEKDFPDIGDDPEHAHISIVGGNIHVHYRFETKTGAHIDHEVNIQESTRRFKQTFIVLEAPSLKPVESTGTCMVFK